MYNVHPCLPVAMGFMLANWNHSMYKEGEDGGGRRGEGEKGMLKSLNMYVVGGIKFLGV